MYIKTEHRTLVLYQKSVMFFLSFVFLSDNVIKSFQVLLINKILSMINLYSVCMIDKQIKAHHMFYYLFFKFFPDIIMSKINST
jgi:hypothetical protein